MIQGTTQQQQKCIYFIDDNSKEETECIHYSLSLSHRTPTRSVSMYNTFPPCDVCIIFLVVNSTKISVEKRIEWQKIFVCLI